tara:strand:- start:16 stop:870 length:855 start_codon:yes stop_codon:yes gene_type:complete
MFVIIFLRKKLIKEFNFNLPIICVGNIYLGGTGKTPLSIFIAKELLRLGKKPLIVRKFYKSHVDEHILIKKEFKNFFLCKNRVSGIHEAEKKRFNTVILDDGFQDYKIKKNLNIICFNQKQLIGNGLLIPAGPLRENLSSLKKAQIVLINGKKNNKFEQKILKINKNLSIFYSIYKPKNINRFKNKKLYAIAGIGNPNNFFQTLKDFNLRVKKKFVFPDHYQFSKNELLNIIEEAKVNNCKVITTEKDYCRIKKFNYRNFEYLKVSLEIKNKKKFINKILRVYD